MPAPMSNPKNKKKWNACASNLKKPNNKQKEQREVNPRSRLTNLPKRKSSICSKSRKRKSHDYSRMTTPTSPEN